MDSSWQGHLGDTAENSSGSMAEVWSNLSAVFRQTLDSSRKFRVRFTNTRLYGCRLYSFSAVSVINYHVICHLKEHKCIILVLWRPEVQKRPQDCIPSEALGRISQGLFQLLETAQISRLSALLHHQSH